MQNKSVKQSVKILCQVSILIALALVLRIITAQFPISPLFGRINFSTIFSQFVPILFGPGLGALANVAVDFLAIRGMPFPHIVLIELFSGILLGVLWKIIKLDNRYIKLLIVILITDIVYATLNTMGLLMVGWIQFDGSFWAAFNVVFWPRLVAAIIFAIIKVQIMYRLLIIYDKYIKKEKL